MDIKIYLNNRRCEITQKVIDDLSRVGTGYSYTGYCAGTATTPTSYNGFNYHPSKYYEYAHHIHNIMPTTCRFRLFFYEWSDLGAIPRYFDTKAEFSRFMDENKLEFYDFDCDARFKNFSYMLYVCCLPNCSKMVCHYAYNGLVNLWETVKEKIENNNAPVVYSSRMEAVLARNEIKVMFYNNSNLYSCPTVFTKYSEFLDFTRKYKLVITLFNEKKIKCFPSKTYYATCLPGYNVIAFRDTIDKLRDAVSNCDVKAERT